MAIGQATFTDAGTAVSDLFAAAGDQAKAASDTSEATSYGIAADIARQNEQFTKVQTSLKEFQSQRQLTQTIGAQEAGTAASGFGLSGSAADLLHESTSEGALQQQILQQQGLVTEQGYEEQAASYDVMQNAANQAATAEKTAGIGADIGAVISGVAAIATGGMSLPFTSAASAVAGGGGIGH